MQMLSISERCSFTYGIIVFRRCWYPKSFGSILSVLTWNFMLLYNTTESLFYIVIVCDGKVIADTADIIRAINHFLISYLVKFPFSLFIGNFMPGCRCFWRRGKYFPQRTEENVRKLASMFVFDMDTFSLYGNSFSVQLEILPSVQQFFLFWIADLKGSSFLGTKDPTLKW